MCRLNAHPAPGLRIAPAAKNAVRERDTLRAMSFPLSNPQNTPPANLPPPPSRENLTPELDFDRIASAYTNGLGREILWSEEANHESPVTENAGSTGEGGRRV